MTSGPDPRAIRVLYLAHRVPYAPNRGDRIRAYHSLRVLREAGIRTHVVAFSHDDAEHSSASRLGDVAESYDVLRLPRWRNRIRAGLALAGSTPLTHVLLDHPDARALLAARVASFKPDVVLAFCSGMARFALEAPLDGLPVVLDLVDVDSAKWQELAATSPSPLRQVYSREARRLSAFERVACRAASAVAVINEREAELLASLGAGPAMVVRNGVDWKYFTPPGDRPRTLQVVFTAIFDYPPNELGARWTLEEIWPKVVDALPHAELVLAGANPTAALRRLAAQSTRVAVTGAVGDIRPHLWSARVAIAPLRLSRGTQNKVLEAAAAGLRSVVTSAVYAGLPDAVRGWCAVADDPDRFAAEIIDALTAEDRPAPTLEGLGWESSMQPLLAAIEQARR